MYIVHIASELAPVAKAGGLGDVLHGLSKELQKQGHRVEIIIPKYDSIHYSLLKNLKVFYRDLWSYEGPYRYHNTIWSAEVDGLTVFLLEPHHPNYLFSRGSIYNSPDDVDRFLYFSRAATEFLFKSGKRPDLIHVHDWPSAIVPVLLKEMYKDLGFPPTPVVLTLHNIAHQGRCIPRNLTQIGLRGEDCPRLQDPGHPQLINLLKGGIEYADAVTTVSLSYEKEIKTPQGGHGLQGTLIKYQDKLHAILNGIDEEFWNPETDPALSSNFPAAPPFTEEKLELVRKGKTANKENLRTRLTLSQENKPLFACITRLAPQKSPELIAAAFRKILADGGQCIVLGSSYSPEVDALFSSLKEEYSADANGAILLDYDESLSHQIYAAADVLLVPSLFEPCGLTQMIAFRYGTVPLVRKTGGLADTVSEENGFVFEGLHQKELFRQIEKAFRLWTQSPEEWKRLRKRGMSQDLSWRSAAKKYALLYNTLLTKNR